MKHQIKNKFTGEVLFEADVPEATESGLITRVALEQAVDAGADLRGADLRGAYLDGADLRGADLGGANLRGANLRGADLRGADLRGAYLDGANLRGADLRGADLRGADLGGDLKLVGERPVISIGPIGSESRIIFAWITEKGLYIQAGCFFGTRQEFEEKLHETHGNNIHYQEYTAALVLIDAHFALWAPKSEKSEKAA